jgi:formate hydrogenlyase subunit 6/NADH:ubiquinone oxidoreductase subunit I
VIELVSEQRCIKCDLCVDACPTNVFDAVEDEVPVIARQEDCQTCFMCEAYCPVDALYVHANADHSVKVDEAELIEKGLLGSYRRSINWNKQAPHRTTPELDQKMHDFRALNTRRLATGR